MDSNMHISHLGHRSGAAVLFLHGFLESGAVWLPWAEKMFPNSTLYIPDLPGHGKTAPREQGRAFPDWSEELMSFMHQQQLTTSRIHVIGHSMGGYLAMEMALLFPRHIGKVVLLHSTPMPDTPRQIERRKRQIDLIKKGRKSLLIKNVGLSMLAPENRERLAGLGSELNCQAAMCSASGMINTLEAIMNRSDYRRVMSQKMKDVLLITGGKDPFMPADYYKTLLADFPEMSHHHFPGCGHACFLEVPDSSGVIVKRFLGIS